MVALMGCGRSVDKILRPLSTTRHQYYLGTGLHTLGLLGWILGQTGPADVYVSTFSTSDAFLSGFLRLKKKGLIRHAILVADLKASRKTVQLCQLMQSCFDTVCLSMNHSKVVLVQNDHHMVTSISSQNQTYGDRAECTMVTTSKEAFLTYYNGLQEVSLYKSIILDELFGRITQQNRNKSIGTNEPHGNSIPGGG